MIVVPLADAVTGLPLFASCPAAVKSNRTLPAGGDAAVYVQVNVTVWPAGTLAGPGELVGLTPDPESATDGWTARASTMPGLETDRLAVNVSPGRAPGGSNAVALRSATP